MRLKLGPMESELWPWTKIEGRRHVKSWFIFRLCQVFPGRTFWGHTVYRYRAGCGGRVRMARDRELSRPVHNTESKP